LHPLKSSAFHGALLEVLKSGNVSETCRKYEIAPNLYYRWKDEVEAGAKPGPG
jgi:transposase-like protein